MAQHTLKNSRSFVFVAGAALAVSALSACNSFTGPNWTPKGYAYHDQEYKSPNPPKSGKFTAVQRATMDSRQADQFRLAIYDLVQKLTARAGVPPKSVFVQTPEPMTPFYATLDNNLRESLRHSGYRLADTADNAYVFTYAATIIEGRDAPAPNVHLVLNVHDSLGKDSKLLTKEEGDYHISGAEQLSVPYAVFPDLGVQPSGPGGNYQD